MKEEMGGRRGRRVEYEMFITNRRIIGHKKRGLIFKKDDVFSIALEDVLNLTYREEGRISKKGIIHIETRAQKYNLIGSPDDVKVIWKEMQRFLGYNAGMGATETPKPQNIQTEPPKGVEDTAKILAARLAKGEITLEQYNEIKKAPQSS